MPNLHTRAALNIKRTWHDQGRTLIQVALFAYLPALLIVAVAALQPGIAPTVLFDDPTAVVDAPFFVGLLSNAGVVIWAATAAICLFTWEMLKRTGGDGRIARFFLASGLLSAYLTSDDLFMIHERLFPVYLSITEGVPKSILLATMVAFLFFHRGTILKSEYALLGLSLGFLGLSFVVDLSAIQGSMKQYTPLGAEHRQLLEDGTKLLGIVGWFVYFARFAGDAVAARISPTA